MLFYERDMLCFDDILLVPQSSGVKSRNEVDFSMTIGPDHPIHLSFPIISAPMDTVTDVEMCISLAKFGGLGILHRFMPSNVMIKKTKTLIDEGVAFGVSVGATNGYMNLAEDLVNVGATVILVDTANGHSEYAVSAVRNLRSAFGDAIHIMAGNVATTYGFEKLAAEGADSVRVGIGGGSACTTRVVSGHGVPTLASIMDVHKYKSASPYNCSIIADGGIRNSGDMVKAFAAGADAVMVGSMLAGTDESPGDILIDASGREVKLFRGMASAQAQQDAAGRVSVAEGISTTMPYKGSVNHILNQIKGGIGSGCSYAGVQSLEDICEYSEYITVSAASIAESRPHAI